MQQPSPPQQQQQPVKQSPNSAIGGGGVIGQSSLGQEVSSASPSLGGYDPIKSLLNQLQQSDQVTVFWRIEKIISLMNFVFHFLIT